MERVSLVNSWAIARGARLLARRDARLHRPMLPHCPNQGSAYLAPR